MALNVHPTPAGAVHLRGVPLGLAIRSPNRPMKEASLFVLPFPFLTPPHLVLSHPLVASRLSACRRLDALARVAVSRNASERRRRRLRESVDLAHSP